MSNEQEAEQRMLYLSPEVLIPNPDNPRLIFREEQLSILEKSIAEHGILVPLQVFRRKMDGQYVILDGERRWICAKRLKLKKIPVYLIPEPTRIGNILTMFNIHNVRERWELMPTALKLEVVMRVLGIRGDTKLSDLTGLPKATISRCKKLLWFPKKYQDMLLLRAEEERLKPDFFIELRNPIISLKRNFPEIWKKYSGSENKGETIIDTMLKKYENNVITDVTDFRMLTAVIMSFRKGVPKDDVRQTLERVILEPQLSIKDIYREFAAELDKLENIESQSKRLLQALEGLELSSVLKKPRLLKQLKALKEILDKLFAY